jgi:hypothetical protein
MPLPTPTVDSLKDDNVEETTTMDSVKDDNVEETTTMDSPKADDNVETTTMDSHKDDNVEKTTTMASLKDDNVKVTTTIDCLKGDNAEEILFRLPSWASLGHAVRASDSFFDIASAGDFLDRFRARHASSPRSFLGVFAQRDSLGLPVFHLAGPARSDPGLVAVARTGDFLLAGLEDDPRWCIHDCRNGHLLLSKDGSLTVYDPVFLRRADISSPQDDPFPGSAISCLLDGGDSSFRVVSLQMDGRDNMRAVEYDSRLREWRYHPWVVDAMNPPYEYHATYAAGLIFVDDDASIGTSSLMIDTRTMKFYTLELPPRIPRYSIGETEDGKICLVCASNRRLQVWLLKKNHCGVSNWEFEKDKPFSKLLPGCGKYRVEKVVAGLAIVWAGSVHAGAGDKFHLYAIDLKNLSLVAKLCEGGTVAYPFHLPWPPSGLTAAKRRELHIDIGKGMFSICANISVVCPSPIKLHYS